MLEAKESKTKSRPRSPKASHRGCLQDYYYRLKSKFDQYIFQLRMNPTAKPIFREFIIYYKMATIFIRPMGVFTGTMANEFRSIIPYNRIRRSTGEIGWLPFLIDDAYMMADRSYLLQTIDKSNQVSALIIPKNSGEVTVLGETYYGFRFDAKTMAEGVFQNHLEVKGNISLGQYSDKFGWEIKEKRLRSDCIVEVLCGTLSVIICDYRWIAMIPDLDCRISMKFLFTSKTSTNDIRGMKEVQVSGLDLLEQHASVMKKDRITSKRSADKSKSKTTMTITKSKSSTKSLKTSISPGKSKKSNRIRELYEQKRQQKQHQKQTDDQIQPIPGPINVHPKKTTKVTSPIKLPEKKPKSFKVMIERTSPKTKSSKLSSPDIITIKIIPEKMGEKSKQDDDTIQLVISRKSQPISETKSTKPSSLKTSIIKSKQSTDPIELPGKLNDFKIEVKTTVELMKDGKPIEIIDTTNVTKEPDPKITADGIVTDGIVTVDDGKQEHSHSISQLNEPLLTIHMKKQEFHTLSSSATDSGGKLSPSPTTTATTTETESSSTPTTTETEPSSMKTAIEPTVSPSKRKKRSTSSKSSKHVKSKSALMKDKLDEKPKLMKEKSKSRSSKKSKKSKSKLSLLKVKSRSRSSKKSKKLKSKSKLSLLKVKLDGKPKSLKMGAKIEKSKSISKKGKMELKPKSTLLKLDEKPKSSIMKEKSRSRSKKSKKLKSKSSLTKVKLDEKPKSSLMKSKMEVKPKSSLMKVKSRSKSKKSKKSKSKLSLTKFKVEKSKSKSKKSKRKTGGKTTIEMELKLKVPTKTPKTRSRRSSKKTISLLKPKTSKATITKKITPPISPSLQKVKVIIPGKVSPSTKSRSKKNKLSPTPRSGKKGKPSPSIKSFSKKAKLASSIKSISKKLKHSPRKASKQDLKSASSILMVQKIKLN
uniref:Serine/arginine repetitive matrix protein 2-like n=1 Tax=Dermatophagoides pteronyssinus TaxID=6956 RepID=A0A6P6YIC0_DERPT|nr:serine/arginine repetitive matrix protein 2-like [Dermatophagoides pteronyssinus]